MSGIWNSRCRAATATVVVAAALGVPAPAMAAPPAAPPAAAPSGGQAAVLAARYLLDEGTGSTIGDSSGNGHDGTVSGTPTWSAGVNNGGALTFGDGRFAEVPEPVVDTGRSFTVSAWVRLSTLSGYNTAVSIEGANVSTFFLQLRGDTQRFAFVREVADSTADDPKRAQADATFAPRTGQWYLLTGVYDQAAGRIALYVNGQFQESAPFTSPWTATGHLTIGRARFGGPVDFFGGSIDDVRLHAAALTPAEVAGLAASARYTLDEGAGRAAADGTGDAPAGRLVGGADWADPVAGRSAVATDGTGGHVDVAAPVVDTGLSFSVAAWTRLRSAAGTQTVLGIDGDRTNSAALRVRDGVFAFARTGADTDGAGARPTLASAPATRARPGRWYHLAGVYDAAAGTIALYVNGVLAATTPFTAPWRAGGHLVLGRGRQAGQPAAFLAGRVDDARLYQFPLDPASVRTLSTSGSWSFDEGGGALAVDLSPNGVDGALRGARRDDGGAVGAGLSFAGDGQVLMGTAGPPGTAAALDFGGQPFSVSGWFSAADGTIAGKAPARSAGGYLLATSGSHVEFSVGGRGRSPGLRVRTTAAFGANAFDARSWHHATAVADRDARTVTVYVDGTAQQVRTAPGSCGTARGTAVDVSRCANLDATSPRPFAVGRSLTGVLDEVALFPYALPAGQVAALANLSTLGVDAATPGPSIAPTLYGAFFEEINFGGVGGLYNELVRNRAFMESATAPVRWSTVVSGGAEGTARVDGTVPLNERITRSLRLDVTALPPGGQVGVANGGYFGVPVRGGQEFSASLFVRASEGFAAPLRLRVEKADGSAVLASATLPAPSTSWQRVTATLRATPGLPASTDNRLVVSVDCAAGTAGCTGQVPAGAAVWLSVVSLFPNGPDGQPQRLRPDLVRRVAEMNPAFLRFPGGNYLEGVTLETRFDWKQTIGPDWERPGHQNTAWNYWSDDGLGLLEYLELAEELGAEPVVGVYAGYNLNGTHVPLDQLGPHVQDALDEIEYITGPADSPWGSRRARDGHPAPFRLRYVEIGNEDFFDPQDTYDQRYAAFHDAIRARYPELKLIATTPVQSRTPDVLDEHHYNSPPFFVGNAHRYDTYPRSGPEIFVGEYAVTQGSPTGILDGAVGEAAFMTGMERNADVVTLASYAPLFVNVAGQQWPTNLIGYDGLASFASPSYHVQSMFANNTGTVVLPTAVSGSALHAVTSLDEATGTVYVKVVNPTRATQLGRVSFTGTRVGRSGTAVVLGGQPPDAQNSLADPTNVAPRTVRAAGLGREFTRAFAPLSVTVLRLTT